MGRGDIMKIVIRYTLFDKPTKRLTVNNFNALMCVFELYLSNEWGKEIKVYINDEERNFYSLCNMYDSWKANGVEK